MEKNTLVETDKLLSVNKPSDVISLTKKDNKLTLHVNKDNEEKVFSEIIAENKEGVRLDILSHGKLYMFTVYLMEKESNGKKPEMKKVLDKYWQKYYSQFGVKERQVINKIYHGYFSALQLQAGTQINLLDLARLYNRIHKEYKLGDSDVIKVLHYIEENKTKEDYNPEKFIIEVKNSQIEGSIAEIEEKKASLLKIAQAENNITPEQQADYHDLEKSAKDMVKKLEANNEALGKLNPPDNPSDKKKKEPVDRTELIREFLDKNKVTLKELVEFLEIDYKVTPEDILRYTAITA